MHEHWEIKQERSKIMANQEIDNAYEIATNNGAIGGKVVGAGGGGFLLFVTENKIATRKAMLSLGLQEVSVAFDYIGTSTIMANY